MRRNQIIKIANKLGWEAQETETAVIKLLKEKSIVKDWKTFFRICVQSENPEKRGTRVREYLHSLPIKKDLVETICDWLYNPDPCFHLPALFNMADTRKESRKSRFWHGELQRAKTFILKPSLPLLAGALSPDPLCDPAGLCDQFLTSFIMKPDRNGNIYIRPLLFAVIARVGFMAFNLTIFRHQASWYSLDPKKNIFAKELAGTLNETYKNNSKNTERKHWLYFALVEKLKEKYEFRVALGKAEKILHVPLETIEARYGERRRIARSKGLSINDIIREWYLTQPLNQYLETNVQSSFPDRRVQTPEEQFAIFQMIAARINKAYEEK